MIFIKRLVNLLSISLTSCENSIEIMVITNLWVYRPKNAVTFCSLSKCLKCFTKYSRNPFHKKYRWLLRIQVHRFLMSNLKPKLLQSINRYKIQWFLKHTWNANTLCCIQYTYAFGKAFKKIFHAMLISENSLIIEDGGFAWGGGFVRISLQNFNAFKYNLSKRFKFNFKFLQQVLQDFCRDLCLLYSVLLKFPSAKHWYHR